MTQLFVNNFSATVAQTFGATDQYLYLNSAAGLPALTGGNHLLLTLFRKVGIVESGHEVIKVTAITDNMLTVVRAVEGAAATLFNVGDYVEARVTAAALDAKADLAAVNAALSAAADAEALALADKQDALVSGANIKTVNSQSILGAGDIEISGGATVYAYDSRSDLRSQTPAAGEQAIVDGLGLFVWEAGSTEPDDDESAFATASGVWLLEAAHWDLVDAWQSPEWQATADDDEDEPLRFATSFATKVLTGSATCSITSVASISSVSFTGTVTGAAVGDRVIATPPAQLGNTTADTGRLGYHAWVSATNTVTIMLTNASAAVATTNTAIRTVWPITVIKS